MSRGGYDQPHRHAVDVYRTSPTLQGQANAGEGGGGGRPTGSELYGFPYVEGLPAFEGSVAAVTAVGAAAAPDAGSAAAALYLAHLCREAALDFREQHSWEQQLLPSVETILRAMVLHSTPTSRELQMRLHAMAQLKELAQSGIHFCVGLDLEPYGSFVSGLYMPQGDLDLSIEGRASWRDERGQLQQVTVDGMEREMKVRFLRALASRIQAKRLSLGQVERILHARVPILKFRDASGLDFDVGIGGSQALFKSTMMGLLAQYEWRFGALVRLVKLWARQFDVNDSINGSLNSFALTLLVVFHLQTRSPPVLPPLCELCGLLPGGQRPMQEGRLPDWHLLQLAGQHLTELSQLGGPSAGGPGTARGNSETLLELLASFFALYEGLMVGGWVVCAGKGLEAVALRWVLRRVRVDTWAGRLRYERWDREGYCMSVEDPFNSADNCTRTVHKEEKAAQVAAAMSRGRQLLLSLEHPAGAEAALLQLFGPGALQPHAVRSLLLNNGRSAAALQWVCPVDLVIPPRIQQHTAGHIPPTVSVNHRRQRGGGTVAAAEAEAAAAGVVRQLVALGLVELERGQGRMAAPPPGLSPTQQPPPQRPHFGLAPGAVLPGSDGMAEAAVPTAGAAVSLHQLRQLMGPKVGEEVARLAEIERCASEAAAAFAVARKERRVAKKAAAKAAQESKRAERGRSKSRGSSRSKSGKGGMSMSRSGTGSGSNENSKVPPALSAVMDVATAAVSNLRDGSVSTMAVTSVSSTMVAVAQVAAVQVAAPAPAPASGIPQELVGALAGSSDGGDVAMAADGGETRVEGKRFGKNMKASARQRKERRVAAPAAGGALSAASVPVAQTAVAAAAAMSTLPGLRRGGQQQQQFPPPLQQQQGGPAVGKGQQQGRDGGRRRRQGHAYAPALPAPPAGTGGGGVGGRVLTVLRPGSSGRGAAPPPPAVPRAD